MKFIVASSNPVKIKAVSLAVFDHFPKARVIGLEAPSGVSAQPMSDEETRQGAFNRAKTVRALALERKLIVSDEEVLCIGLEGGVFHPAFSEDARALWSTVWVVVLDYKGRFYESNGARFPLPAFLAEMLHDGQEMGPSLGHYVKDPDLRQKEGMIGYLTKNFTNRTHEYSSIAKVALGLWYGAINHQDNT